MLRLTALLITIALAVPTLDAPPAAAQSEPKPLSKPVGPLASYYAGLRLDALHELLTRSARSEIYDQAKATLGRDPLWQSENPDPTWILVWRQNDWSDASDNAETLVQAAFNRAWEASCVAEFRATHAAHGALVAALQPELARLDGLTNYYERISGYAALAAQVETTAAAAGIPLDRDPSGPIGFRVTVLAHAIAFHQRSSHGWLDFPEAAFPHADRLRREGRDRTTDVDFERAAYCAVVASRGGLHTTGVARLWDARHGSAKRVAWPTVTGDEKAVGKRRAELIAATTPRLTAIRATIAPTPEFFHGYTVTAITGDAIAIKRIDRTPYDYACKRTRRIARIDPDGRVSYEQTCKTGRNEITTTGTVAFAELPPGVTPAIGDRLVFHADVLTTSDKVVKHTAALHASLRKLTLTGRHLLELERGGAKLAW